MSGFVNVKSGKICCLSCFILCYFVFLKIKIRTCRYCRFAWLSCSTNFGGITIIIDMNNGLINDAKEILDSLKKMRVRLLKQLDSLDKYDGWNLKPGRNPAARNTYYDVIIPGSKSKVYLGSEKNEDVLNVKRYRYATEAVSILNNDIALLDDLIGNYISPDYLTINARLPITYKTNFTPAANSVNNGSGYLRVSMPEEAIKWKEHLEAEKAKYPPYKPEQLKHPALDGTMMRSKSEVIIANILMLAGIPFVYEAPIFIDGEMLLPDFTILSLIDLKTEIIIEHQGMLFVDEYAKKHLRSMKLYLKSDKWIPNMNLFFTFDDAKETLEVRQVVSILRKFIKPSIDDSVIGESITGGS